MYATMRASISETICRFILHARPIFLFAAAVPVIHQALKKMRVRGAPKVA